jgi:hypothetical protein
MSNPEVRSASIIPFIREISVVRHISPEQYFHSTIRRFFTDATGLGLEFPRPDQTKIGEINRKVESLTDSEKEEGMELFRYVDSDSRDLQPPKRVARTLLERRENRIRMRANMIADSIVEGMYLDEQGKEHTLTPEEQELKSAQLIYALEQRQKTEEERELERLMHYQEQQALTKEQTDRMTEILNRSFDRQIERTKLLEQSGRAPISTEKAERIRRTIIPWIIHAQNSPRLKAFARIAILGLTDSFEHPLDSIPTALDGISQIAQVWFANLDADAMERYISEVPEGHELETVIQRMDIPIKIRLRNDDGSIRDIETTVGPAMSADFEIGNWGRAERVGYSSPHIEGGRSLPVSWFKEQMDSRGRPVYDPVYLDSKDVSHQFPSGAIFKISDRFRFPITRQYYDLLPDPVKKEVGEFNGLSDYDLGSDPTDRRLFINPNVAFGQPIPFKWFKERGLSPDNQNLLLAQRIEGQKFYTHPDFPTPFSEEYYESLPDNQKIKDSNRRPMGFDQLTRKYGLKVIIDTDPTKESGPTAYGEILWTMDKEHQKAFQRGVWTNFLKEKLEREYNLPSDWRERIVSITGDDTRNEPLTIGEKYKTGEELWDEANNYYYAAFLSSAHDILTATAYLRRFDPAYSRDNIPDPMKKSLQYLRYMSYYGMASPEARWLGESLTGDTFEAYPKLFPEYAAITGNTSFELRYHRPILYRGSRRVYDETTWERLDELKDRRETSVLTDAEKKELESLEKDIPILVPFRSIVRDNRGNPVHNLDGSVKYRQLDNQEKKILMNMFFTPRLTPYKQSGIPQALERLNTVPKLHQNGVDYQGQPFYWGYYNVIANLYKSTLDRIRQTADPADINAIKQEYRSEALRIYREHKSNMLTEDDDHLSFNKNIPRQEIWAKYQNLTDEERTIIADIDFGISAVSMGAKVEYSDLQHRLGWRALGDFIDISGNISHFNAGTEYKSLKKRGMKYLLAEAGRLSRTEKTFKGLIQALDIAFYQEFGTQFLAGKDLSDETATRIGQVLVEAIFGRSARVLSDYQKQVLEQTPSVFDAVQIGRDGQRLVALQSIPLIFSFLGLYNGPVPIGSEGSDDHPTLKAVAETGKVLTLPKTEDSELFAFTRGIIIAGNGSVNFVEGRDPIISDQNSDAVMQIKIKDNKSWIDRRNFLGEFGHGLSINDAMRIITNYAKFLADVGVITEEDRKIEMQRLEAIRKLSEERIKSNL